jgi:uncharacterized protein YukE
MSTYSLSFAELQVASGDMLRIASQINEFLEELQTGTMKAILEWESVARDEFDSQRVIWAKGASDMTVQAQNAKLALDNILAEYQHGEDVGIKIWAR